MKFPGITYFIIFFAIGRLSVQDNGSKTFPLKEIPLQGLIRNEDWVFNYVDDNSTVWLRAKTSGDKVLISVKDNGQGIPMNVLDKIYQPFFTTKRTGQGTGLGLSLSYDIVKAHGGELKVETKEGEGKEFVISLPR